MLASIAGIMKKDLFVTQPFIPPLEEFTPYLEGIWERKILTNNGPLHQELEQKLCEHLLVPEIALFNNGTIALLSALQALNVTGEVITTPYSFVATAHSILWNGLTPVFVDIDPVTYNLDPNKIEAALSARTTAIMPVHCYGHPCDTEAIAKIARKHNLKVIYDAAHAFGVTYSGGDSILAKGDLSAVSFHATKVFNTFEGGAIVCPSAEMKRHINNLKNFGIEDEVTVVAPGINGKMSEINAAFGLLQLKYLPTIIESRSRVDATYRELLTNCTGIRLPPEPKGFSTNYSYFPILVEDDYHLKRDDLYEHMKQQGVYARRYFYPLISAFPMYRNMASASPSNLPIAHHVADRILCLPISPSMTEADARRVASLIKGD